ncbi:MAG TPA: hypothetical protein VG818_11990 [Gemmatimonadaceae bacterium]|nr:hypothetical protein [Gemmatimonadaceae bacterium]
MTLMAALAVLSFVGWRALRLKAVATALPNQETDVAPAQVEEAPATVTARAAAEPAEPKAARTPVPTPPSQSAGVTGDRSYAPLPEQDNHVDPEYQARQRGRIVALSQEQLPTLESRAEALEAAGDHTRAAELRFRVERLRVHLAKIEKEGDAPATP